MILNWADFIFYIWQIFIYFFYPSAITKAIPLFFLFFVSLDPTFLFFMIGDVLLFYKDLYYWPTSGIISFLIGHLLLLKSAKTLNWSMLFLAVPAMWLWTDQILKLSCLNQMLIPIAFYGNFLLIVLTLIFKNKRLAFSFIVFMISDLYVLDQLLEKKHCQTQLPLFTPFFQFGLIPYWLSCYFILTAL